MPELRVVGVTAFDLFFTQCPCGELTVHGFWQQLKVVEKNLADRYVRVELICDKCGISRVKKYRLTTARRTRHRLVNWVVLGMRLTRLLPGRWWDRVMRTAVWLERRFPI